MKIVVYAERFRDGEWDVWEHTCTREEVENLESFAKERARKRSREGRVAHEDVLAGARHLFDGAVGSATDPQDGDTRVYCVCLDQIVIGVYEKVRQYSTRLKEAREFVEVELEKIA